MAQRATGTLRTTGSAAASRAADLASSESPPPGIPLNLAPILTPYRKNGRVSIRVEGLPPRARLSRGRNNGDRSWSLMSDELDGLNYLPPKGVEGAHTLAVRIVSLDDADGATLAVVDVPVMAGDAPSPAVNGKQTSVRAGVVAADDSEIRKLRSDLAETRSILSLRETELLDLQKQLDAQAGRVEKQLQGELNAARTAWEKEMQERLAAAEAEAAANLEKTRMVWLGERNQALAEAERRIQERIAWARQNWTAETQAEVAKAEKVWKSEEAARFAAAEARWREEPARAVADANARIQRVEAAAAEARLRAEQAEKALRESRLKSEQVEKALVEATARASRAEARAEAAVAAERNDSTEMLRLRDQLHAAQAALSSRDNEVAQLRESAEQERRRLQQEAAVALLNAESTWKASEAARLALTEARLRAELGSGSGEAQSRAERAESALAQANAQLRQLEAMLAGARAEAEALKTRTGDSDVAELRADLDDMRAALVNRETALADASARVKELEAALAGARTEAEASRGRGKEADLARLRADLASAQAALARRDVELAQARTATEREQERARKDREEAVAKAEANWSAGEAARLASIKDEWHRQSAAALRDAIARYERAEAESNRARSETVAVRHEFAAAQSTIADLETELAVARANADQARERWALEAQVIRHEPQGSVELDDDDDERRVQFRRRLVRDIALIASVGALVLAFYPRVSPMLPDNWSPRTVQFSPAMQSFFRMVGAPSESNAKLPERPVVIGVRANLRAGPSAETAVLTILPREMTVTQLDRRGNWVLVRVPGRDGEAAREGWIFNSFLKNSGPAAKPDISKSDESTAP